MAGRGLRLRDRRTLKRVVRYGWGKRLSSKNPTGVRIGLARRAEILHKGREKRLRCCARVRAVGCKFAPRASIPLGSHTLCDTRHVPGMRHIPEMSEDI